MSLEQENKNNDLTNMQSEELEKYGVWVKRPVPDSLSINPFDNTFTVETASTLFTEEDSVFQSVSADNSAEEEISLSDFLNDSSSEVSENAQDDINQTIEETEPEKPENLEFNDMEDSALNETTESLGAAGTADFNEDFSADDLTDSLENDFTETEPEVFGDIEFENLSETNELTPLSSYDFAEPAETASEEEIPDPVFQDSFPESMDELSFTDSFTDSLIQEEPVSPEEPIFPEESLPAESILSEQLPSIEDFETDFQPEKTETLEQASLPKDPFDNSIFEETGLEAPAESSPIVEESVTEDQPVSTEPEKKSGEPEEIDFSATEEVSLDDFLDGMDFDEPDMPVAASTIAAVTAAVESGREEEISLDEFGVDFDSNSGDGTESVSLDEFGIDFSDSSTESVSLEDFIPAKKKEKNDIINDPPLEIELSFDDNFVMETVANPEDNIEGENDFMDAVFTGDSFDNFDDIFENITDIGETAAPVEEQPASSEISFDDVSEFDDLLNSFTDDAPVAKAETGAVSVSGPAKQRDYDLFVSMEDEEKPAAQSATVQEEEEEEAVVELYTDRDESEGFNISAPIEGASSSFSLSDMADFDDSIQFIDETDPFEQAKDPLAEQETDPAISQPLPEETVAEETIAEDIVPDEPVKEEITESEEISPDTEQNTITEDENIMQDLSLPEDLDLPDDIDLKEAFNMIDSTDFSALAEETPEETVVEPDTEESPVEEVPVQEESSALSPQIEVATEESTSSGDPCSFQYESDSEYPIVQEEEIPQEEPVQEPEVSDAEESFLSRQPDFDQNEMDAFVSTVDTAENCDRNDIAQFAADTITDSDIPTVSSLLSDFDNKLDNSSISEYTDSVDFTEDFTSMNEEPIISDSNTSTNDVLNKIMNELSALRSEINTLRTDIDALKAEKSVEPEQFIPQEVSEDIPVEEDPVIEPVAEESAGTSGGFFADDGEDDTIALSGDELNNILNSADFTEETAEAPVFEGQPAESVTEESDLDAETEEAEIEPMAQIEEDMSIEMPEVEEPIIEEPAFDGNDFGLDDPEAEVPSELPDEIDIPQMDSTFEETVEEPVAEEDSPVMEETEEIPEEEPVAEEPVADDSVSDEPQIEDNSAFADIMADIQDSSEEEASDVAISEDELARALQSAPVSEEEPAEEPVFEESAVEEPAAEIEEPVIEDPVIEEPVFEEVSEEIEDDIDETPTDTMFESEDWNEPKISEEEILGDAAFEDNGVSLDDDFEVPAGDTDDFASEVPAEEEIPVEEPVAEEISSFEEPEVQETEEEIPAEVTEEHVSEIAEEPAIAPVAAEESSVVPDELKQDVKSVLLYMDQLLENLPEEKIAEFARSEHFEVYRKLFTELGLA